MLYIEPTVNADNEENEKGDYHMITRHAIIMNADMMCCCDCMCKNRITAYLCMSSNLDVSA